MRIKEPLLIVLCWLLVAGQTVKADNIHVVAADGDLETVKHLLSEKARVRFPFY
ncbi:MAG: hypothetical protein GTO24_17870 [candidate division Zixibacteria bacterium]|nr:hypothetical protein [candidate division Zixibacteria bacterium]